MSVRVVFSDLADETFYDLPIILHGPLLEKLIDIAADEARRPARPAGGLPLRHRVHAFTLRLDDPSWNTFRVLSQYEPEGALLHVLGIDYDRDDKSG